MRISQLDLISAIGKHLEKRHGKIVAVPRQFNAIIAAANLIVEAFDQEPVMATPGMGKEAWINSDDIGVSSMYMAFVLCPPAGVGQARYYPEFPEYPHPKNPQDFGRCVRLIEAVPELRAHLALLADGHGPVWANYATHWEELEALYREELPNGKAPKLYKRMQELQA